tara:strand:+ start:918 stop:1079 length:162 start_codon:yes stop_codon:yes gene_type:complete
MGIGSEILISETSFGPLRKGGELIAFEMVERNESIVSAFFFREASSSDGMDYL